MQGDERRKKKHRRQRREKKINEEKKHTKIKQHRYKLSTQTQNGKKEGVGGYATAIESTRGRGATGKGGVRGAQRKK